MLGSVKEFIKSKPKFYDYLNAIRPIDDELELWIDRYSISQDKKISFIQVGANDGLRWDPIRRFIIRDKWKGVLIEPLRPVYKMLCRNYSYMNKNDLIIENCAISKDEGVVKFWSYSDEFLKPLSIENRLYYLRKSSLDKGQVEKSLPSTDRNKGYIECYETISISLEKIIDRYFPDKVPDLIFIDAEGLDDQVVKSIDFNKCTPGIIIYENHNLGDKNQIIESYLSQKGYLLKRIGGDTLAKLNS